MNNALDEYPAAWHDPFDLALGELPQPVIWPDIFGNANPVNLELCSGKGRFLLSQAQAASGQNWLGIEISKKYARLILSRAHRAGLSNVRILGADAGHFLAMYVPDSSVQSMHIYYPDPWPKRRHHKRRIIQSALTADLVRTLAPGGRFVFVTDHEETFNWSWAIIQATPGWAQVRSWRHRPALEQARTNYEVKWLQQGREVYEIEAIR